MNNFNLPSILQTVGLVFGVVALLFFFYTIVKFVLLPLLAKNKREAEMKKNAALQNEEDNQVTQQPSLASAPKSKLPNPKSQTFGGVSLTKKPGTNLPTPPAPTNKVKKGSLINTPQVDVDLNDQASAIFNDVGKSKPAVVEPEVEDSSFPELPTNTSGFPSLDTGNNSFPAPPPAIKPGSEGEPNFPSFGTSLPENNKTGRLPKPPSLG